MRSWISGLVTGYAQCTVLNTDNTVSARTDDCIVMLPIGNRTVTVKMLSLSTGRIVSSDKFRLLPMPDSAIARMNDLAKKEGRGNTPTPTSESAVQHSVRKAVTFAAAPTGYTEDHIVRMNDESQGEIGVIIPHDDASSDEMVAQEVGVHTESGTADAYTDYDAIDTPEEHDEPSPSRRRTMMDMFRYGTDESALTTNNVHDTEEKIGGDYTADH